MWFVPLIILLGIAVIVKNNHVISKILYENSDQPKFNDVVHDYLKGNFKKYSPICSYILIQHCFIVFILYSAMLEWDLVETILWGLAFGLGIRNLTFLLTKIPQINFLNPTFVTLFLHYSIIYRLNPTLPMVLYQILWFGSWILVMSQMMVSVITESSFTHDVMTEFALGSVIGNYCFN